MTSTGNHVPVNYNHNHNRSHISKERFSPGTDGAQYIFTPTNGNVDDNDHAGRYGTKHRGRHGSGQGNDTSDNSSVASIEYCSPSGYSGRGSSPAPSSSSGSGLSYTTAATSGSVVVKPRKSREEMEATVQQVVDSLWEQDHDWIMAFDDILNPTSGRRRIRKSEYVVIFMIQ